MELLTINLIAEIHGLFSNANNNEAGLFGNQSNTNQNNKYFSNNNISQLQHFLGVYL